MDRQILQRTFGPFIVNAVFVVVLPIDHLDETAANNCSFFQQLYNGQVEWWGFSLYAFKGVLETTFLTLDENLHLSSVENPRIAESFADTMRVVPFFTRERQLKIVICISTAYLGMKSTKSTYFSCPLHPRTCK